MATDHEFPDIPLHLQKELRSRLASLHVKLTLASEHLKLETDADIQTALRDEIVRLKREARETVALYREGRHGAEAGAMVESEDGFLVFGELEAEPAASEPPPRTASPTQPLTPSDIEIVFETERLPETAPAWPPPADPFETGGALLDEIEITLALGSEATAAPGRPRAVPGGPIGHALAFAAEHAGLAAGGRAPRAFARLLETVAGAIEAGAGEAEVVASALHDALSGPDDEITLSEIGELFGERVREIVASAAALKRIDPWIQRDRSYLQTIAEAPVEAVRNTVRARLLGLTTLAREWRFAGAAVPDAKGVERLLWSLRALGKAYRGAEIGALADAWDRAVAELERAASGG